MQIRERGNMQCLKQGRAREQRTCSVLQVASPRSAAPIYSFKPTRCYYMSNVQSSVEYHGTWTLEFWGARVNFTDTDKYRSEGTATLTPPPTHTHSHTATYSHAAERRTE